MSGPTLQLNITAPGQKNVEASVSAVERLAAALRDLPKASSELLKLQKALQGAGTATGGLKGGAGDLKELVGEIKNLGQQLNTSFGSLEETIKKGWGRATAAQEAGAAKAAGAGKKTGLPMLARQALEQAEALSKAQAAGDRRRLKSASGSEGATQQLLYGTDVSAQEKLRSYYQGLVDAERAGVAKLEAEYQKSIAKLDAVVPKVIKAATQEGYKAAGPAWWDKVLADQKAATAKLEAEYQKSIAKLDAVVPKVIKAATKEGYQPAGAAWWDKVIAEQEAALLKVQKLNAKFAAASAAGQASTVLAARSQLNQGVAPAAVAQSFGSQALAAAQATTFSRAHDAVHASARRVNDEIGAGPLKLRGLTGAMNEAHSAARGLASGFGAMFLTYGSLAPLLAGAALSHSFVQSLKTGLDVRQDLETIRVLSQESTQAVKMLEDQLVELGRNGPFGPREVAGAMKTLSLAGLNADQVSKATKPSLDLALTGDTTIEKAAESLVAIGTAYGYLPEQFASVSDAITKAAAISMSSVNSMMESFRAASVVAQQYKVSLADTATGLAVLANIGIRGSSAGVAIRQMYSELSGASSITRKAVERLGVQIIDTNVDKAGRGVGGMRPLLDIVKDLNRELARKNPEGYNRAIQAMSNERGGKALVGVLESYRALAREQGTTVLFELERVQKAISEAAGFSAVSAAQMIATPLNQVKAASASFQTSLFRAFTAIEPTIFRVTDALKNLFNSQNFQGIVNGLVASVANLTSFLVSHAETLKLVIAGYLVWKGAAIGLGLVQAALVAVSAAQSFAAASVTGLATAYMAAASGAGILTVASAGATAGIVAMGGAASAARVALAFLTPIGLLLGAGAAAWALYSLTTAKASATEKEAAAIKGNLTIKSMDEEIKRLTDVEAGLRQNISLRDSETAAIKRQAAAKKDLEFNEQVAPLRQRIASANQVLGAESRAGRSSSVRALTAQDDLREAQEQLEAAYGNTYMRRGQVSEQQAKASEIARRTLIVEGLSETAARAKRVFGNEGPDVDPREAAAAAKAAEAERKKSLDHIRQMYDNQQSLLQTYYNRDEEAYKLLAKVKGASEEDYLTKSAERQDQYYADQQENLARYEGQLTGMFQEKLGGEERMSKGFLGSKEYGDLLLARAKAKADSDVNFLKNFEQTVDISKFKEKMDKFGKDRLPAVPERTGTPSQLMLDDWQDTEKLLFATREDFTTGFIERGRTMWADWLQNGRSSFKSLRDLAFQTFADITYKRFIAAPLAGLGNSLFDKILGPAATAQAPDAVDKSFSTLGGAAGRLTEVLGSLGSSFWQLFVQAGQGLAVMLSNAGSGGIGGFLGNLFGASAAKMIGGSAGSGAPMESVGEFVGPFAKGGAFGPMQMFAKGDLFNSPHIFKFGAGGSQLGMLGEAGPEAIMPLTRGPGGSLGVRNYAGGGGGRPVTNVSVVVEKHGDGNGPVTQTKEQQPDGSELVRIVLNETAKDISRGGVVRKSMTSSGRGNLPRY